MTAISTLALVCALLALAFVNLRIVSAETPLVTSIFVAIITYAVTYVVLLVFYMKGFHSVILSPIRRDLQFVLSSIVIDKWIADIVLYKNGDARISHEFSGSVNFGRNRWIRIGITSEAEQKESLDIKVINVDTGKLVKPQYLLDFPTYKRLNISFDRVLERGDRFHYKVEYLLEKCFFFDKEDYYMQSTTHYERRLIINVRFPPEVAVERAWSEILTDQGDSWERHTQPLFQPNSIEWTVEKASLGNRHFLRWITKTQKEKTEASKT